MFNAIEISWLSLQGLLVASVFDAWVCHLPAKSRLEPCKYSCGWIPKKFLLIPFRDICMEILSEVKLPMKLVILS